MNIGSPAHGIHFTQGGIVPIDPTTIANVIRVMYYSSPYPVLRDSTTPAANGDQVTWCFDQKAVAGFPRDRADNVDAAPERPIMVTGTASDGLQFDILGANIFIIENTLMAVGLTEFTAYAWGTQIGNNSFWCPLGTVSDPTSIAVINNFLTVTDDSSNAIGAGSPMSGGKVLVRVNVDSGHNLSMNGTGMVGADTQGSFGAFTFNAVGLGLFGTPNGDAENRFMGSVVIGRNIVEGSAEDLGIRAGISDGTYTGEPGYSL